jgi:hypothetical protein
MFRIRGVLENSKDLKFSKNFVNENYSKSLRFGFRDGSPERSPKMNKETKNIIVV